MVGFAKFLDLLYFDLLLPLLDLFDSYLFDFVLKNLLQSLFKDLALSHLILSGL